MKYLAPLLIGVILLACTPVEEPVGVPELPASIVRTFPEDDTNNVPGTTEILVEFDRVPRNTTMTVRPRTGTDIDGTVEGSTSEVVRRFVPAEPLSPDVDYVVDVAWADGEATFEFETSLLGFPLTDADLLDLPEMSWSVLIEPFGDLSETIPFFPGGQDLALILAVHEDSQLDEGEIHLIVAPTVVSTQLQDQCQETTIITAGPDGVIDTEDDTPGIWENPDMTANGARFATGQAGEFGGPISLRDWELNATVLPSRQGLFVHRLLVHTSLIGFDGLVPDNGPFPPGTSACEALGELGAGTCVPCPTGSREPNCLPIELTNYEGQTRASAIRERTCADIIDSHFIGVICPDAHERYDADNDGVYELCPEWEARR